MPTAMSQFTAKDWRHGLTTLTPLKRDTRKGTDPRTTARRNGVLPGTPEWREACREYWQWSKALMALMHAKVGGDSTVEHADKLPTDDRPDYLDGQYLIAYDTETDGLAWEDDARPFLATISDYDRDWLFYLPGDDAKMAELVDDGRKVLRDALLNAHGLIFHNASFDIHHSVAAGIATLDELLAKDLHDTDLLARIVLGGGNAQYAGGFGLKRLAAEYLDADAGAEQDAVRECMVSLGLIQRPEQKSVPEGAFKRVWETYPEILEKYAMKDTRYTYDLFYTLIEKATEADLVVYEMERTLLPTIIRMEHIGMMLDANRVDALFEQYTNTYAKQREVLYSFNGGEPWNPDAPTELLPIMLENGVELTELTDTGQIRTDKWVLERHRDKSPVVDAVLDIRATSKFLSTYLGPMKDRNTVHPSYWQLGARTSRISCSRPNMQNIPIRSGPEMRSMFVPRPGYKLVVADYSSIELRLLAYYMNDQGLWDIIKAGDPFLWLGSKVFGTEDQEQWSVKRQSLKNGFYAITYGAGGPKLAQTIGGGMTAVQGRALAKSIKAALGPNYKLLTQRVESAVRTRGYVSTILGRKLYLPRDKGYIGLNSIIQGSASELMKVALIRSAEGLADIDAYPLLTVHDEIVAEAPARDAVLAQRILEESMLSVSDMAEGGIDLAVAGTICDMSYAQAKD